jgi:MFS family permease
MTYLLTWLRTPFDRYWLGRGISGFGSQITFLALPLTAAVLLHASPAQMGILTAAGTVPFLLLGLMAGMIVDRTSRRRILVAMDLARALALALVPALALAHALTIEALMVVNFVAGCCTTLALSAEGAFLPSLVPSTQLVNANSKLAGTMSFVETVGPGVAGGLIQFLTAPVAIVIDAASFLVSAAMLISIRSVSEAASSGPGGASVLSDLREGLSYTLRNPTLRALIGASATLQLFGGMMDALLFVYVARSLLLPAAVVGLLFTVGSASGIAAAIAAPRLSRPIGLGRILLVGVVLIGVGWSFVPLASGPRPVLVATMLTGALLFGTGNTLTIVTSASLVQTVVENRLLGRVQGTMLSLGWGALPLGAVVGGVVGQLIGIHAALWVGAAGMLTAGIWIAASPAWRTPQASSTLTPKQESAP